MGPVEEERWVERDPTVEPAAPVRPGHLVREEYVAPVPIVKTYDPRVERAIWFVVGIIAGLIAIRFFLKMLGASMQADFVRFIYGVTGPLVGPFQGIFPATGSGNYVLEPESLIAIAIYVLIGWALVALVRIVTAPRSRPVL